MDQGTAYILAKLDLLIDRQRDQTDMLAKLLSPAAAEAGGTTTTRKKRSIPRLKFSPFWQTIAGGGCVWVLGLSTKSYLDHGGAPLDLIEALLKLALGLFFGAA